MNTQNKQQTFVEIDIKELLWSLLSQWKAVLLFSLVFALLTCGAKHMKDIQNYNAQLAAQKKATEQIALSIDEKIARVMEDVPENEKAAVEYVVNEQDWIDKQKNYLNSSILMNTDPTNQRVLSMVYDIDADDNDEIELIIDNYLLYIRGSEVISAIKPLIANDTENKYISELFYDEESDNEDAVLKINMVLTEEANAEDVIKVMKSILEDYSVELQKEHPHHIELVGGKVAHIYHRDNVQNRNEIFNNVNALEANIKSLQGSLTETQKTAISTIVTIKKAEFAETQGAGTAKAGKGAQNNNEELIAPGWSKKYGVAGFLLGVIIYVCAYILHLISGNRLGCAANIERYSGLRLLGEVYYDWKYNRLSALFHSCFFDNMHYRDKADVNMQMDRTISIIEAVCKHNKTNKMSFVEMIDSLKKNEAKAIINSLSSALENKGISVDLIDVSQGVDEHSIFNAEYVIPVVDSETKASSFGNILSICSEFDIKPLGSVFINAK